MKKILIFILLFTTISFGWGSVDFYQGELYEKRVSGLSLPPNSDILVVWRTINENSIADSFTVDFRNNGIIDIKQQYFGDELKFIGNENVNKNRFSCYKKDQKYI